MKPAARITDFHVCPQVTGTVPHVGGPILPPGCPTVLIGGLADGRVADMATCVGPPDAISAGAFTTLIGRMPAARLSDPTSHGGVVVSGFPTVLIGDAPASVTVVRRGNMFIIVDRSTHMIYMVGVQEFSGSGASQAYVDRATESINSTWSGPTTFEGEAYTVDSMVSGRLRDAGDPANPMATQIDVVQTSDPASVHRNTDPANQPAYGRSPGHQHSTEDDDGGLTIPHEFGHAMGLPDEYTEGPRNPDGTRSVTRTGPAGGLMGDISPGSRPTPDNFNSLITGNGLLP
jgi:uncharacterized Zn-binding protein involved in type VI secretion